MPKQLSGWSLRLLLGVVAATAKVLRPAAPRLSPAGVMVFSAALAVLLTDGRLLAAAVGETNRTVVRRQMPALQLQQLKPMPVAVKPERIRVDRGLSKSLTQAERSLADKSPVAAQHGLAVAKEVQERIALTTDAEADAEVRAQLTRVYKGVAEVGSAEQRTVALNNLAVLQVQTRDYAQAVETLLELEATERDPERRRVIEHNIGRSLELDGRPEPAWSHYMRAVRERPQFTPALEGCFRVATPSQLHTVADVVIESRQAGRGLTLYIQSLQKLPPAELTEAHLRDLIRLLIEAKVGIEPYETEYLDSIRSLGQKTRRLAGAIESVNLVYQADLADFLTRSDPDDILADRPRRDAKLAFLDLLMDVAEAYAWTEEPAQALARYYAAWRFNVENTEAALRAAGVLLDDAHDVDPQGAFLDRFVDELVSGKMAATARGDLITAIRLHLVLATIFERKANETVDRREAQRQWERVGFHLDLAEDKLRRIREPERDLWMIAELQHRRGRAYDASENPKAAANAYLQALSSYAKSEAWQDVAEVGQRLEPLASHLSAIQREEYRELQAYGERVTGP